jgi:hypothetical protein
MREMEKEASEASRVQLYHKMEVKARIWDNTKDRIGSRQKLEVCMDPKKPQDYPGSSLVNIVRGKITPASVNVDSAVKIGEEMLEEFKKSSPEGFYSTISKKVETMGASYKSIQIGESNVCELDDIYSRVIALLATCSDRDIDVNDVLSYELAPVSTSMLTKDGMRVECGKTKSSLKRSLQIEVSLRKTGVADATVIDGSILLWTIHWPEDGSGADFIANVKKQIAFFLTNSDVYLIFDRYHDYSIKSTTRDGRETGVTRKHYLLRTTKLPAQTVVFLSVDNKKQLIRIIFEELIQDRLFHQKFIRHTDWL